jgi:hypothetical protein
MTTPNHYRDAEDALRKTLKGPRLSTTELATAQLQAMLAVANELRNIHNELTALRNSPSELIAELIAVRHQIIQLQDALVGRPQRPR